MTTSNVINFPKKINLTDEEKDRREDINNKLAQLKVMEIDGLSSEIFDHLIEVLRDYGVLSIQDQNLTSDLYMLEESISSYIYRVFGQDHPFHKLTDNIVIHEEVEGEDDSDTSSLIEKESIVIETSP